jgi:hypothetical protein
MPTKLCERCGAEYEKTKYMSKKIWEGKKYCGNECASMAFWDAKKGRNVNNLQETPKDFQGNADKNT